MPSTLPKIFLLSILAAVLMKLYLLSLLLEVGVVGVALYTFLFNQEVFVGAYDDKIKYNGRWVSSPDQMRREASFGGSSFEFTVFNTTSVSISLANNPANHRNDQVKDEVRPSLVLTPAKAPSRQEGPISFFHILNGSANATYHQDIYCFCPLAKGLNPNVSHTFRVSLPYNKTDVFQFRGLWLGKRGLLLRSGLIEHGEEALEGAENKTGSMLAHEEEDATSQRTLIEILASTNLLTHTCSQSNSTNKSTSWAVNWPTLLQDNFLSSTFSTIPMSPKSCITSGDKANLPQTTFFRSGPPNSTLHNHPWTFTSKTSIPGALILSLGLPDVEAFLSSPSHGKHDFTAFIDTFSQKYSTFIKLLRRTVYSPSSLAGHQNQNPLHNQAGYIDESHLYNSAPSTLPIFIVLPPVPSSLLADHSRQLKSILHHTATKTLNDLKWHIGDQKTIIVDPAGWLNDDDFTLCSPGTPQVTALDFSLTQSGHIKFAHHLSLRLCPYIGGGKEKCPFAKHGEYVGNLVVPEADGVGKLLEQKRVGRIKEVFGISRVGATLHE